MTRPPCSEPAGAVAGGIADRLGEAGFAVAEESVPSRLSKDPWLAAYAGLSALAALLIYPLPLAAALAGIAAVVFHARESDGRPLLRRASCTAVNVVAKGPDAETPELIVIASLVRPPCHFAASTARRITLVLHGLMAGVAAAGAAAWVAEVESELPRPVATGGVAMACAVVVCVLALHRPSAEGATAEPALELLVELAPSLRERRVWLVGVGGGADAFEGFLDAHAADVAGSAWLYLASWGSDRTVAVSEEGAWRERRSDRWLMGAAEEAGADVAPHRAATLATPLLAKRRRALTLLVPEDPEARRAAATVARSVAGV